ncbi:ATP-dependent metallopeptidase FtsH/Yme1/Tma family protein, partial [Francisella tularensis]|uniref:ATP-dependent metallopeptidase FtsH/Yme1/Tma family protein n=1 Tax=Francisella tularensis TaxID=263 RepID=UPI002381B337|nr:ATP-dependent metallopeptidase FtsH/Yme1/Tma family protein [Francisella tularensis subsp. holarctica]
MDHNIDNKNNIIKYIIFCILIIGGMILLLNGINDTIGSSKNINYSSFISKLKDNHISVIDVDVRNITGKTNEGERYV